MRLPALLALLALAAPALAGCLAPALPLPSPQGLTDALLALGPLHVAKLHYDFGATLLTDPRTHLTYPAELQGSVHVPTDGHGPFPLVLFLHGRHGTCTYLGGVEGGLAPAGCPRGTPLTTPIDSFEGYDYLAASLASRGYVVASASANEVNDRDEPLAAACVSIACEVPFLPCVAGPQVCDPYVRALFTVVPESDHGTDERAQLIARTLDHLAALNATRDPGPLGALAGIVDMGRIGLMGHSRGGEAVARFITWNAQRTDGPRYPIGAVFSLAPSDFARWQVAGVPWATLLPSCDGDVFDMMGDWLYDDARYAQANDAAPKHLFLVEGADHDYYNTVWTQDDAEFTPQVANDPYCGAANGTNGLGTGRLSPEDQRRTGLALIDGFFRHYLGGEQAFGPLLRGEEGLPAAACPGGQGPCPDRLHASYHAPADARRTLLSTRENATLERDDLGGAATYAGLAASLCQPEPCPSSPNWATARQLALAWTAGGNATWGVPAEQGDVRAFTHVTARIATGFGAADATLPTLHLALRDASGKEGRAPLGPAQGLFVPPGRGARFALPSMVRVPLADFGVDLASVREVRLEAAGPAGNLTLTDLQFQRLG